VLPLYRFRGEYWVAGEPGARYAIELRNDSRENLVALGVIPPERRRWRDRPSAFPGANRGYVPDPN
jgi:hypothetical protein